MDGQPPSAVAVAAPVPIEPMADTATLIAPPTDAPSTSAPPAQPALDPNATETLYIQNLNERVKPQVMKTTLTGLFKGYGPVLSVTAHSNLRMRGQAFVAFPDKEMAAKALKEVKGFPLYSKPMVSDVVTFLLL